MFTFESKMFYILDIDYYNHNEILLNVHDIFVKPGDLLCDF